ncbi:hypothetical protein WG66_015867 [Moniliophthora roreri]|nr:hypothetical protein WG66_015867 [Moniliophthora roreri]
MVYNYQFRGSLCMSFTAPVDLQPIQTIPTRLRVSSKVGRNVPKSGLVKGARVGSKLNGAYDLPWVAYCHKYDLPQHYTTPHHPAAHLLLTPPSRSALCILGVLFLGTYRP